VNSCGGRVARSGLVLPPPVFDSIGQETFLADYPHLVQAAMYAGRQKFLAQPGQGRRLRSAEHVWSNGEIELIDQTEFQQRSKQRRTAFARNRPDIILAPQNSQHLSKVDIVRFRKMQDGFLSKRGLSLPGHSRRRKNENGRAGGLKNFQSAVDPSFVGNDHAHWRWSLLPFDSRFLQLSRKAEPDIVALQTRMPDQDRVGHSALPEQVQLVFTRSEIDRRKIPRRNFTIYRHCEGGRDKWARVFVFHWMRRRSGGDGVKC
jgi:hypothetical protein